jgi:hypothetical protein
VIHRTALFVGAFLVTAGIVMLAGSGNAAVEGFIADALRLWPLAVIALGAGLLLRRTSFALAGILVAAIVPGLLLGGAVVAAPDLSMACDDPAAGPVVTHDGTFDGAATVDLSLICGEATIRTVPGAAWHLDTLDIGDDSARVQSSADRLIVTSPDGHRGIDVDRDADGWGLALPTGAPLDVHARIVAGQGRFDLSDARVGDLSVVLNAGSASIDLTTATVGRLDVEVAAGSASIHLPASGDLQGELDAAAGSLELCRPESLGLRIHGDVVLGGATFNGLVRVGDAWQTPDYPTASAQADLFVTARAGSVVVDPEGGCK